MVVDKFKRIAPVPSKSEFVDIVLTRTQRRTPTVVHPQFAITRIRQFYMRKVRFTQDTFHEKLTRILEDFPKLDDIHPFYADLINVLYDRDHYKIALSQISVARQLIDNVCKDYVRMLKYADTPFRCKQLKRAALGRMVTVLRKQGPTFEYLEEVRKHLARLPSIDPSTRTLLVCGYPNVGKSSFMNKVTRADVEVQPYAFTTKSLFVGHMDYKFQPWQVIDTPGILDHPLEERNNIEMQSITALAHLHCAVLFFIDISGQCGYSIEQQVSLFTNISPLFVNKPVMIVATKVDAQPWETLDAGSRRLIDELVHRSGATFKTMSNFTEHGINDVRVSACEALLARRVASRMKNAKKVGEIATRVNIIMPRPRDGKVRGDVIPESVRRAKAAAAAAAEARAAGEVDMDDTGDDVEDAPEGAGTGVAGGAPIIKRWLERDREREGGGPGVYRVDTTRYWDLKDPSWRTDIIPEIMDGKNVADYVDPDIEEKLAALEAEEEALEAADAAEAAAAALTPEQAERDAVQRSLLAAIKGKIRVKRLEHQHEATKNRPTLPRTVVGARPSAAAAEEHLREIGVAEEAISGVIHAATAGKRGRSEGPRARGRSTTRRAAAEDEGDDDDMDEDDEEETRAVAAAAAARKRARSSSRSIALVSKYGPDAVDARGKSRVRSRSRDPATLMEDPLREGLKGPAQKAKSKKIAKRVLRTEFAGKQGESDRFIGTKMPKHLFSGKRGIGKSDWR